MLEQLLEKNMLQLPEAKRLEDVGKCSNPNYCKYHRLVGHPTEKCFVLKDRILELATQGCIILETDNNIASSNTIFVQSDPSPRKANPRTDKKIFILLTAGSRPATKDKEGWEVVTQKKKPLHETPVRIFIKRYATEEEEQKEKKKAQKKRGGKRYRRKSAPAKDVSITNAIRDDLDLPIRSRQALIKFVAAKDDWHVEVEQLRMRRHDKPKVGLSPSVIKEEQQVGPSQIKEAHSTSISFKEANMLLGERSHNRPLFVFGSIKDRWINRILLDSESAINILPNKTVKDVGLVANDLQASSLMIQGFNQERQRALGTIRLELQIGDMTSHVLFHVIDAHTYYNVLLGRPWLHNNKVVPSTLHQCFKYYQDGEEKTVFADECPFTESEASFADAKFYSKEKSTTSSKITPPKAVKDEQAKPNHKGQTEEPILRYVPQSRRKKAPEEELGEAPAVFEEGGQATIDQLKKGNLGTEEDPRPTFLSTSLSVTEEKEYVPLLSEYKDVFALSYTEMPGLDSTIAVHKLAVKIGVKPVKQTERRFRPELIPEIAKEVDKLFKANFIREVKYLSWIANIVPVKKKNGKIQVCVDFRDLNKACPKDDFLLPITELMVDATKRHEVLSFMEGSSGYKQIRMDPKDEEMTAFRTPKGIFCYKVMPFGLKNAGATYQIAMQRIFDDFQHKFVECYVDDLVVKTKARDDHIKDLRTKIDVIQQMPEPKNQSELKSLQGHLTYIRRFISNLAGRCQPFSCLMKKDTLFEWDESCRRAFQNIKGYLMNPPVLMAPAPGKPLLLYFAAQEKSLGALLAQNDNQGKERALYYLSLTMVGPELNYSPIEKMCLALIFAVQKLRHYLLAHSTNLISRADPLKYVMSRPMLSGRLAKWALFSEFEINFIPQKAVKGQGLANFLAGHPIPTKWEVSENLPAKEIFYIEVLPPWRMYFDGAARKNGAGAGVLFMSPNDDLMPYSFILSHCCTNNEDKYHAVILGLGMTIEMGLNRLEIFGDSALVIKQLIGDFEVRKEELVPYHKEAQRLLEKISDVTLGHVPRANNSQAEALAGIAASLA
ncbi:hypothetical protein H6P81_006052 [Aristolochia fimbriata]|uniref:RNase H type-1 domain-containing protein n=1 Tax=Aristolochia fimbriata TaxID=158543 RepID=A0AAV7EWR1_ARIFI|nr:hypothetical protein H6P81_006052 [Aristolochia fimbriata]